MAAKPPSCPNVFEIPVQAIALMMNRMEKMGAVGGAHRSHIRAFALVALGLLAGCNGGKDATVSGIVYLDDQPLDRGNVTFYRSQGGAAAYGRIGADGVYQLKTGDTPGLATGEYKVTVVATAGTPPVEGSGAPPVAKLLTPRKYGQLQETDLKFDVAAGANKIDLRLNSD